MFMHDAVAEMLYAEQKRKLDQVTRQGWQLVRPKDSGLQAATPRQTLAAVPMKQQPCTTC